MMMMIVWIKQTLIATMVTMLKMKILTIMTMVMMVTLFCVAPTTMIITWALAIRRQVWCKSAPSKQACSARQQCGTKYQYTPALTNAWSTHMSRWTSVLHIVLNTVNKPFSLHAGCWSCRCIQQLDTRADHVCSSQLCFPEPHCWGKQSFFSGCTSASSVCCFFHA